MTDSVFDPDSTSRSHIHRAIQRAANEYFYGNPHELVRRASDFDGRIAKKLIEIERSRSRKTLNAARIACHGYISGSRSATCVTAQEIRSSVNRSRRWSGRDNEKLTFRGKHDAAKLNRPNDHRLHQTCRQKCTFSTPETAYHHTACDLLLGKASRSSYDHLSKIVSRSSISANRVGHSAEESNNRNSNLPTINKLPEDFCVPAAKSDANIFSKRDYKSRKHCSTTEADWSLLHCSKSSKKREPHQILPPHLHNTSNALSSPEFSGFDLSNLCPMLSDPATAMKKTESKQSTALMRRKHVHRAIQAYCRNEKASTKPSSKVVVVHLPNPYSASAENKHHDKHKQTTPKISMRSGHKSALLSLLSDVETKKENIKTSTRTSSFCHFDLSFRSKTSNTYA